MWKLIQTVERLMREYPSGSQLEKESNETLLIVKLYDLTHTVSWWLSEYDPINHIAFWYVVGLFENDWGSVSITELEKLTVPIHSRAKKNVWNLAMVEIDLTFKTTLFKNSPLYKDNSL
jgi:hypothetical protein